MTETIEKIPLTDANYPDLVIRTNARVDRWHGGNWHYRITMYMDGPGEALQQTSSPYPSKRLATEAMLQDHQAVILKLTKEFAQG